MAGEDWLTVAKFSTDIGAVGAVLWLLAGGRLVARSWADAVVTQANKNSDEARKAAEAADRRADALQVAMVEMTAAVRAVESLVRSQGMGGSMPQSPPSAVPASAYLGGPQWSSPAPLPPGPGVPQ